MTVSHTPGPWAAYIPTTKAGRNKLSIACGARYVCDVNVFSDEDREQVRFIVTACNAHADLVAALEWIATADHDAHPEFGSESEVRPRLEAEKIERLMSIARAALTKVRA